MTQYRDETESLRAKVTELEEKLASAEAEAAKLRGETSAPVADTQRDAVLGEPLHLVSEIDLPFAISDAGYEAIANLVRERRKVQVSQVGRSLTAPGFSLTAGEGWTRLRLETDLRGLRAGVFAGASMGGIFLSLPVMGVVLDMATHMGTSPWHLAWLLPSIVAGSGLGMRALARRTARSGRAGHEGVFAGIRELAEAHRATPITKVRVEQPSDVDTELDEPVVASKREARDAR
ncbi:MAG: hypothetical protein J0L92_35005 [Deltaproteobacteria bacterium]|nr:hypothetical protein [Deltaproteobacteria bacterium]